MNFAENKRKQKSMFQVISETASARFTPSEKTVVNQRIQAFQEKKGIVFSSFKELLLTLLTDALNTENAENKEIEKPVPDGFQLITNDEASTIRVIKEAINKYAETIEFTDKSDLVGVLLTAFENAEKEPQTIEVEKEVVKTVERTFENNEILLTLTDEGNKTIEKKLILLNEIAKRRNRKFGGTPEPVEALCEKMIFNDGTIFNLSGEFFTGF